MGVTAGRVGRVNVGRLCVFVGVNVCELELFRFGEMLIGSRSSDGIEEGVVLSTLVCCVFE